MKAILAGFLAMALIAIGAYAGLTHMGLTSQARNSGADVRLD